MISVNNKSIISIRGKVYCENKIVQFDFKDEAKIFAKQLRQAKRFDSVRIKKKQKSEKSFKGKWFEPIIWYEIEAYPTRW